MRSISEQTGLRQRSASWRVREFTLPATRSRPRAVAARLHTLSPVYAEWMNNAKVDDGLFMHGSS
jgi:hypothetical protein